jgi:ankyrin repeat protein
MVSLFVLLVAATGFGLCLFAWLWTRYSHRGEAEQGRVTTIKQLLVLFVVLTLFDVLLCLVIIIHAGLGHSARANAQAPYACLLSFVLVVLCPVAAFVLYRYCRLLAPEKAARAKTVVASTILVLASLILILVGKLGLWPPLIYAANHGHLGAGKLLLDAGASTSVYDPYGGGTPLTIASSKGDREMVEMLLEKGADVNAKDRVDQTALMAAYRRGDQEILKLLIEHNADVLAKTGSGWTVLMMAFSDKDMHTAYMLLEYTGKNDAALMASVSAWKEAVSKGDEPELKRLLDVEAMRNFLSIKQLELKLESAVLNDDLVAVKQILEIGLGVDTRYRTGQPLLTLACQGSHGEIVKLALERGADVNALDDEGRSALMSASQTGNYTTVSLLLDRGAQINVGDRYGQTPLIYASLAGREEIVKMLLERGADVRASTRGGRTALSLASENGHTRVVELLKAAGASE